LVAVFVGVFVSASAVPPAANTPAHATTTNHRIALIVIMNLFRFH
jgi:hypothetical protein